MTIARRLGQLLARLNLLKIEKLNLWRIQPTKEVPYSSLEQLQRK
jgi:hypothetical protein